MVVILNMRRRFRPSGRLYDATLLYQGIDLFIHSCHASTKRGPLLRTFIRGSHYADGPEELQPFVRYSAASPKVTKAAWRKVEEWPGFLDSRDETRVG